MTRSGPVQAAAVVGGLGGRAAWSELAPWMTRARIRGAVGRGELVRAARGIYALPDLPPAQLAAARARGALSFATAAEFWGLELVRRSDAVHVTVARGARPAGQDGVTVHQSALTAEEVRDGVTSPLRTVLDCATALPFREGLAVADSALALRFVTARELVDAAQRSAGPGRPRRIAVARSADRRAANALESALRGTLLERRLDGFEPQHAVWLNGREVHVDLGDGDRRMAIEAEGYATHGSRSAFAADCERYDELGRRGWLVLRFAWGRSCSGRTGSQTSSQSPAPGEMDDGSGPPTDAPRHASGSSQVQVGSARRRRVADI